MIETLEKTAEENLIHLPENWFPLHIKIRNKDFEVVPFELNPVQVIILRTLLDLERQGRPIRIIILKARKLGVTSFFCGMCFYWCCNMKNREALLAAHDDESSVKIFSIVKLMDDENPESPPTDHTTRKEIIYSPPHRSSLSVQTAGRKTLGRGSTPSYVHNSEVAHWTDAKETLTAVLNAVPNRPGTMVTLESTACGMGGEFYNRWVAAMTGKSDFVPLFFPWFDDIQNRVAVESEGFGDLDDDEVELQNHFGVDDEQLQWRRKQIQNECGGDLNLFRQENPSHWEEAFLVTGRPVFRIEDLQRIQSNLREPEFTGALQAGVYMTDPGEKGPLHIFQTPLASHVYGIGVDTAEGIKDESNIMPDASAAKVIDVSSGFMVASMHSREEVDEVAEQVNELGLWYNDALVGIEINNTSGGAMRENLKRLEYPNLYLRETWDQQRQRTTKKIGWRTDTATRKMMISDLFSALRDRKIYIAEIWLLEELRSFVYNQHGKAEAMAGCFDDQVIALAIAWQMCLKMVEVGDAVLPQVAGEQLIPAADYDRPDYLINGFDSG